MTRILSFIKFLLTIITIQNAVFSIQSLPLDNKSSRRSCQKEMPCDFSALLINVTGTEKVKLKMKTIKQSPVKSQWQTNWCRTLKSKPERCQNWVRKTQREEKCFDFWRIKWNVFETIKKHFSSNSLHKIKHRKTLISISEGGGSLEQSLTHSRHIYDIFWRDI